MKEAMWTQEQEETGVEEEEPGQPVAKRQLQQGILTMSFAVSILITILVLALVCGILYLVWKRRKGREGKKTQSKIRRKAMVKIPMLLSKPKKSYKSVSKTELLKETHDQHQHEEPPAPDNGNIFEEIQSICDKEPEDSIGKLFATLQYDSENCMMKVKVDKYSDYNFINPDNSEDIKRRVSVTLEVSPAPTPDTSSCKTSTLTTNTQETCFDQEFSFKNVHYNRFQILSLQFRVTIDDKIVGEVTQDIANLDKNADFLVPVELDLNVTPAVVQEECGAGRGGVPGMMASPRWPTVMLSALVQVPGRCKSS